MNTEIVKFEYNGQAVNFEPSKANVMVNATQMARIFDKKINEFMSNETTKNFISACLKSGNSRFLNIEKEEDLFVSKQKTGTWMHRLLALKFAAWLNPQFEIWVYTTIEQILFGDTAIRRQNLTRKAELKHERELLEKKLNENEDYKRFMELKAEEMRLGKEIATSDRETLNTQYQLMFPENN